MMLVGNVDRFAIECHIEAAFPNHSHRSLGYFVLHVSGGSFGVREHDATMLGCSYDEVKSRIAHRGQHTAAYLSSVPASSLGQAHINDFLLGITGELEDASALAVSRSKVRWAPDGDAAFDDGSYVFQFDVADQVRLIAFKNDNYRAVDVHEAWLPANEFYGLLSDWVAIFDKEWQLRTMN